MKNALLAQGSSVSARWIFPERVERERERERERRGRKKNVMTEMTKTRK